ncbi:HAD family phosphatase [Arundinibacter roseus]|uniref:HAD family phosphatase n=2 Tax=Arundinibacter roseus TaxID=2070510 RepID=A0A4R4KA75_9BACT|nr:HAD family phosphatase [Arundinibacter roseus]
MDGVICHTNPYHSMAFREFFSKRNLNPTDEEFAQHMFGKSNSYILRHFLQRDIVGDEFNRLEDEKESLFRKIYEPFAEPIQGFFPFVEELKTQDVKMAVATSAPLANLEMIAAKLGLDRFMDSFMASEDVTNHKPDPEVYLKSAERLGMHSYQCVVFEDSFSGVTAALNAGMRVVGVLSSHSRDELPPCNLYIQDYAEISYRDLEDLF